jgi:hypothetical protein
VDGDRGFGEDAPKWGRRPDIPLDLEASLMRNRCLLVPFSAEPGGSEPGGSRARPRHLADDHPALLKRFPVRTFSMGAL